MKKYIEFDLLSREHSNILKGIAICIVIFVHICNGYLNFPYLSPLAGVGVAIFLFSSGYGLSKAFNGTVRHPSSIHFWKKRIIKVWVPAFIVITTYSVILRNNLFIYLTDIFWFRDLKFGWYLQFLFIQYFIFWAIWKVVKSLKIRFICFGIISAMGLFLSNQLWAEQSLSFFYGVLWSQFNIDTKIKKLECYNKISLIGLLMIMGILTWTLRNYAESIYFLRNIAWMIVKLSITIIIILCTFYLRKVKIMFYFFTPIGSISYALYLIHGQFLFILKDISALNVILYFAIVITLSYILTWVSKEANHLLLFPTKNSCKIN